MALGQTDTSYDFWTMGLPSSMSGPDYGYGSQGLLSNIAQMGAQTGFTILKDIYGGIRPGTLISTPQGSIMRLPEGQTNLSNFATGISSFGGGFSNVGMGTILFWGAIGLGAFALISRAGKD